MRTGTWKLAPGVPATILRGELFGRTVTVAAYYERTWKERLKGWLFREVPYLWCRRRLRSYVHGVEATIGAQDVFFGPYLRGYQITRLAILDMRERPLFTCTVEGYLPAGDVATLHLDRIATLGMAEA